MSNRIGSFLVALCTSLSLIASSAVIGVAQGRSDPRHDQLTEMVICDREGGTSTIYVDDAGNRADPDQHCDLLPCRDCLSAVAFFTPPLVSAPAALRFAAPAHDALQHDSIPVRAPVFHPARAPPTEV
ncbi:DUF2946 family protein [Pararhodobacter oceanensis]|uniref:DUF2946 family protein n=1 Tax=Pararhodobacter oceanensis TaxID=2172121 RepID=UPI003A8D1570